MNCLTVFIIVICSLTVGSSDPDKFTLHFTVAGRYFPDKDPLGTVDPYVLIKVTEENIPSENVIAKSDTINNSENPDWPNIFTFGFDRHKKQSMIDDKIGQVWINVSDYVDHNQYLKAKLNRKGYLIIKKT